MRHTRDQRKPPSTSAAHLRSFLIGVFYAAFMLALDRNLHLKSGVNLGVMIVMSLLALLIVIGTIRVSEKSAYHLPMKPFTILAGFFAGALALYAFLGGMGGNRNFLQQLGAAGVFPPSVQKPFENYLAWSAAHSLTGRGGAEEKPAGPR
jgi:heme A synthase